jgi:hypothetical protein
MSRFEGGAGNRREVHRLRHTRWKLVAVLCAVAVASTTAIPVRTEKINTSHRAHHLPQGAKLCRSPAVRNAYIMVRG